MELEDSQPITRLLRAYEGGDQDAFAELSRLLYPQLKAMARAKRGAGNPRAPGATTLVHEAYLKILGGGHANFADRRHFFAVAATAMRQVVLDQLRTAAALKRQGEASAGDDEIESIGEDGAMGPAAIAGLEQGLAALATEDPQALRVFECKYFAGYSTAETAEALGLAVRTVERGWTHARSFLSKFVIDSA